MKRGQTEPVFFHLPEGMKFYHARIAFVQDGRLVLEKGESEIEKCGQTLRVTLSAAETLRLRAGEKLLAEVCASDCAGNVQRSGVIALDVEDTIDGRLGP